MTQHDTDTTATDFAREASEKRTGVIREMWDLLRTNKKWWLTPIVIMLLLIGVLVILGGTTIAPFIYTLF